MESIEALVKEIKEEIFSSVDLYSFVLPSAYDTAWMAMIPHPQHPNRPMFHKCLDWILRNQREEGFWGETDQCNAPTIESLSATLTCMVALKRWNVGSSNIVLGLQFIHANTEKLLGEVDGCCPRQFAIVFPAMIELAQAAALDVFPDGLAEVVDNIFCQRQRILEMEKYLDQAYYPPLASYIEALPETYISREHILEHQSEDGSLFQSPSATAHAFMATRNKNCMVYLESIVQRCKDGVPTVLYPIDEELIKLCMVDRLERLGLAEYFLEEIEEVLCGVYRNWKMQDSEAIGEFMVPQQIYKDSLAFRLLRMHGYHVSPRRFCWFLQHEDVRKQMEENCESFLSVMLNVHRATELMFTREGELEEARSFSRKLLEKGLTRNSANDNVMMSNFQKVIEHELKLPWLARLDHLEHRLTIEETQRDLLWVGKASYYGLLCLNNTKLLQLAKENYTLRQSIFKNELEELTRWSEDSGVRDIGFGREKTTYCYFAIAACAYHPPLSYLRMAVAKSAILLTVIDDFFDVEGSLDDLNRLTDAVARWDGEGLRSHNKVIFSALDNLVNDIATKSFNLQGHDMTKKIQDMWYETCVSWLKEAEWSRMRIAPSIDEYIENGMTSIGAHTLTIPASYLINPGLAKCLMGNTHTATITRLLMLSTRLLNDIQGYQKENEDGKMNLVLLHMKENPEADIIEDSVTCIKEILEETKKELLELILVDGISYMPKPFKQLHLTCLKVFQMFYNSSNGFDSPTEMLHNINKAIFDPLTVQFQWPLQKYQFQPHYETKKGKASIKAQFRTTFHDHGSKISAVRKITQSSPKYWYKGTYSISQHYASNAPLRIRLSTHDSPIAIRFRLSLALGF